MNEGLLTTEEVANILGVDERTVWVYRNLKENPLPFVKLQGAIRFRKESVQTWIEGREKNAHNEQDQLLQRANDSMGDKDRLG